MTTLTVPQTEAELNGDLPAPTAAKTMRRDSLRRGTDPRCLSTASMRLPRKRFPEVGQWCIEAAARVRKELLS